MAATPKAARPAKAPKRARPAKGTGGGGMRGVEIWREAWRNLASGASRAVVSVLLLTGAVGAVAGAQVLGVVDLDRQALAWRQAGASVQVVSMDGQVDAAQCEALTSHPGIVSAGALRKGQAVRIATLPSTRLETFEATPGLATVIGLDWLADPGERGVWVSDDLAEVLGVVEQPAEVPLVPDLEQPADSMTVAALFAYPSDGRMPALAYTLLSPVPAMGGFDACWMEIWPETDASASLLTLPVQVQPVIGDKPVMPQIQQLNATLGTQFGASGRLARLPTMPLGAAAAGLAALLGLAVYRSRRLELASSLHAGVPKTALPLQTAIETGLVALPTAAIILPACYWLAIYQNPDPPWTAFHPALATTVAALAAYMVAAVLATVLTREKHLFKHFKNR
jgi:hypothetical protein